MEPQPAPVEVKFSSTVDLSATPQLETTPLEPGTSTLPTSSAGCWASPRLHNPSQEPVNLGTAQLQTGFGVDFNAQALKTTSVTVRMNLLLLLIVMHLLWIWLELIALQVRTKLIFIYQLFPRCDFTLARCGDLTHSFNALVNMQCSTSHSAQCADC